MSSYTLEANLLAPSRECYDKLVKQVFLKANIIGTLSVVLGLIFYFIYQAAVSIYVLPVLLASFFIYIFHLYIGLKTSRFKLAMSMYILNSSLTILAISLLIPSLQYEALIYLPIGIFAFFYNIFEDRSIWVFSFFAIISVGFMLYEIFVQHPTAIYPINILSNTLLVLSILYTFSRVLTLVSLRRNIIEQLNNSATKSIKANSKYQSLFENSFDAILVYNFKEKKITKVNQAFREMFRMESTKRTLSSLKKEELIEPYQKNGISIADYYSYTYTYFQFNQMPLRRNILQRRLTGEVFEGETTMIPVEGNPNEFLVVIKDISAYKKAQQELQLSENRNRTLIEQNLSAVILADENTVIKEWNQQAVHIFGWTKEEAIGQTLQELIIPKEFSIRNQIRFIDFLKQLNDRNAGKILEIYMKCKDGSRIPVELTLQYFELEGKRMFSSFIRDISDKKQAKDALKEREGILDAVVNSSSDGIVLLDKQKQLVMYNEYAYETFKRIMKVDLIKDIGIGNLFFENLELSSSLVQHNNNLVDRAIAGEELTFDFHSRPNQADRIHYYTIKILPVRDSNQAIIGAMCVGHEITELKEKSIQLTKAKEKAEGNDRLKSAFLANMSHEIRTPMNSIVGFSKLLQEESLTARESKEFIQIINTNCLQLMNIIDNILDISKIETGQVKIKKKSVNLSKLLEKLYELHAPMAAEKELALVLEKNITPPTLNIDTDATKLQQILTNLLINAIKFTDKGHISFGYTIQKECLHFWVRDTGIGISEEQQSNIFNRFQQVENELKRSYEGVGLGLSISSGLAKLLGGNIQLESELGEGSLFSLILPYENKIVVKEHPSLVQKKLLLIEQDVFSSMLFKQVFKNTCALLTHAENTSQAAALLADGDFDLVLMNIENEKEHMILMTEKRKTPIIALGTADWKEGKEQALSKGFVEYLTKPIKKQVVLEQVGKILAKK